MKIGQCITCHKIFTSATDIIHEHPIESCTITLLEDMLGALAITPINERDKEYTNVRQAVEEEIKKFKK